MRWFWKIRALPSARAVRYIFFFATASKKDAAAIANADYVLPQD